MARGIKHSQYSPNVEIQQYLYERKVPLPVVMVSVVSGDQIAAADDFEAAYWSGRFAESAGVIARRFPQLYVQSHLCRGSRGDYADIRQGVIARLGGSNLDSDDLCTALGLAMTWWDLHPEVHIDRESSVRRGCLTW